jgi:hypothetical protein
VYCAFAQVVKQSLFRLFQHVPETGTELNPASMRVAGVFFSLCSIVPLKYYIYGGEKFISTQKKRVVTCWGKRADQGKS